MNRRSFFRRLVFGAAAVILAAKLRIDPTPITPGALTVEELLAASDRQVAIDTLEFLQAHIKAQNFFASPVTIHFQP